MLSGPGQQDRAVRMEKQQREGGNEVACLWVNASATRVVGRQRGYVVSRWTVACNVRHWVSGPSAQMTSCTRLQDLSVRLSLSLCLSIAGPMSLTSVRTTLMSRWNTGHWVSGPSVLVIDHQRLRRQQSEQWTTVGNYL